MVIAYQNNAEAWLTGDANDDIRSNVSALNILKTIYLLYLGYSVYNNNNKSKYLAFLYNLSITGWILNPAALQIEIAMRINALFIIFGQIYTAYIFYDILIRNKKKYSSSIRLFTILVIINFLITSLFRNVFSLEATNTLFIWDSDGRAVLPD